MRLPDFANFPPLEDLRMRMGASQLGFFKLGMAGPKLSQVEVKELEEAGIEVGDLDSLHVLDDGTIAYKNSRVLLHIRDVQRYMHRGPTADQLPRFHIANCSTLQEMRANNRFGRYVVATRQDGKFIINLKNNSDAWQQSLRALWVCKNCLSYLGYDGYASDLDADARNVIFSAFELEEFFRRYPKSPIYEAPLQLDLGANLNEYPPGWREKSQRLREGAGWRCQNAACRADLSRYRKYLDVHHKNGQKFDVSDDNLVVLCIECHAEQYQHIHIKRDRRFGEYMRLRHSGMIRRHSSSHTTP